jgi:hypothetical protein
MTYFLGSFKSAIGRQFADNVPHLAPFRLPSYHKTLQSEEQSPVFEDLLASSPQSVSSGYLSEEEVDPLFNPESSLTTTTTAAPTKSAILDLPTDILYVVSDHLDAASTWSLALTCRDLYCIGFPKTQRKLKAPEKRALFTLLERDPFSKGHYFCHKCTKLHRFDPECGPIGEYDPNCSARASTCVQRDIFAPTSNTFGFSYHHARLVMNRHLYGPEFGIPIENICISHEAQRGDVTIACSTKAKIIHDELFMQRTYKFTVPNGAGSDFRKTSGHRDFRLCEHLPLLRSSSVYQQGIPELQARPIDGAAAAAAAAITATATSTTTTTTTGTAEDQFLACAQAPGSCGLCLLDYDISIERAAGNGDAPAGDTASDSASAAASDSPDATTATVTECEWQVTINAYHQLGDCRSPDDWKWARFTEKSRPHLFLPNRPNRRGSGYSPGAVKRMWEHGEERRLLPVTVHLKRHSI